ncbi:hypothetical protein F5Y16DRAFT_400927 [Xylariaceae sp. FL0255]|nr:hypothetical protein F5Y16DRAFT_400927 [Xylariaceae sp. FL0255]
MPQEQILTSAMENDQPPPYDGPRILHEPPEAQSSGRFVMVPLTYIMSMESSTTHSTIHVNVNIANPPTYDEFLDQIFAASKEYGPLPLIYKEREVLDLVADRFRRLLRQHYSVFFVWDFAPEMRVDKNLYMLPRYGMTDGIHLTHEEFVQYLHAIHSRRISYVLLKIPLQLTAVGGTPIETLRQL